MPINLIFQTMHSSVYKYVTSTAIAKKMGAKESASRPTLTVYRVDSNAKIPTHADQGQFAIYAAEDVTIKPINGAYIPTRLQIKFSSGSSERLELKHSHSDNKIILTKDRVKTGCDEVHLPLFNNSRTREYTIKKHSVVAYLIVQPDSNVALVDGDKHRHTRPPKKTNNSIPTSV